MSKHSDNTAKPIARELGWTTLSTRYPFEDKLFRLREDHVRVSTEKKLQYAYEERSPAVLIVPVTKSGEIILIRQYRYPVDAWCAETPAGGSHDTGDMPFEEVARKELREEVGATAERIERVTEFYTAPSFADEVAHVFLAWGAELSKEPRQEKTEAIEHERVPAAEALRRARNGEIKNGTCALALLVCEERLRRAGVL